MRMFDSFITYIVITVLSCGVAVVNIFLIYAIWEHSPTSMGKFKNYMLTMSIADFSFASSIAFLFLPNLLFPLPAGIVVGLLKYLGPIGGPIAVSNPNFLSKVQYAVSMTTGGWMMMSIWQCCLYRMYVFYQFDRLLEIANEYFTVLMILEVLMLSIFLGINTWRNTISYQEFLDYAKRHGHKVSSDITKHTPLVAFNLDSIETTVGVFTIAVVLFGIGVCIGAFNFAVQKKLNQNKSSMSKESFRMQKSLTLVLLAQAIIPGVSIAVPVLIYCTGMAFSLVSLLQSPVVEWFSVLIIGAYPFVNSSFCLYHMKPYRKFTKSILQKIIWCYPWKEEVVVLAESTGNPTD